MKNGRTLTTGGTSFKGVSRYKLGTRLCIGAFCSVERAPIPLLLPHIGTIHREKKDSGAQIVLKSEQVNLKGVS